LVEALVHQTVTILLAHTLSQHSVRAQIIIKAGLPGDFGQWTAGVAGFSEDNGLEKVFVFLERWV
jgi:hypothetical protein